MTEKRVSMLTKKKIKQLVVMRLDGQQNLMKLLKNLGYQPRNKLTEELFNLAVGGCLAVFLLPLGIGISLLLLVTQGTPIIFSQERLGKNKKPFIMYKFRTMTKERKVGTVWKEEEGGLTPLGGFLRKTRLDEIPQLINVLKRDMNVFGPRPVRQVIAEKNSKTIKKYNDRFLVKPGLFGAAQILMPHRAPKKYRARLNTYLCRRRSKLPFLNFLLIFLFLKGLFFKRSKKSLFLTKDGENLQIKIDKLTEEYLTTDAPELKGEKWIIFSGPQRVQIHIEKKERDKVWKYRVEKEYQKYIILKYFLGQSIF